MINLKFKADSCSTQFTFLSILSAIGTALSIWQTRLFFITRSGMGEFHSFCNIGQTFDCTAIEMSPYSEFISGLPLSGFAIAGYLLVLILSVMGLASDHFKKNIKTILVALTLISVLFSLVYLVIMIGIIGKLCILCLSIDFINILLLFLSFKLPPSESSEGVTRLQVGIAGVTSLILAFLISYGLNPQADLKKDDLSDIVESVINTPSVTLEIPSDAPVIGDQNAKVTIVKVSDYECPACKMGATAIHPLFKRYPRGVKFVFINYPLDQACNPSITHKMHEFACEAAEAAICGAAQGKFVETYETLFDHQKDFEKGKIASLLHTIPGIDKTALTACLSFPSTGEKLRRDIALGGKDKLNIQSTPTFFINGKKVEGGLPTNVWIDLIDRMLK